MTIEDDARQLASIAAARKILDEAERTVRDRVKETITRGSVAVMNAQGEELGLVSIPRPSRTVRVEIVDQHLVLPWAVDMFGAGVADLQLTEQGRLSVIQHAKLQYAAAQKPPVFEDLAGVRVTLEVSQSSTPRFTPAKSLNLVELLRGMWSRGEVSLASLLAIEGEK